MNFGISLRSTRQAQKPITINLKKTDVGYKLVESKESYSTTISLTKNMLFRTDSKSAQSKETHHKSVEKEVTKPIQNLNASASLATSSIHTTSNLRRQPVGKLSQKLKKPFINSSAIREKSPTARLETEHKQKREVFVFNNYSNDTMINQTIPVKSTESIVYLIC